MQVQPGYSSITEMASVLQMYTEVLRLDDALMAERVALYVCGAKSTLHSKIQLTLHSVNVRI